MQMYRISSDWKVGEITCHIAGILKPGSGLAGIRHFGTLETDIPSLVLQDLIRELTKC